MTLQQIHYILTIAEAGSMNKAADILYLAQPSLTSAVKELEKELGITIFLRSGRGVTLTNDGTEFLLYARQIYQQYEIMMDKYGKEGGIKKKFGVSTQHYSFAVKAFVETVHSFDTLKYDFALRETSTLDVIEDVGNLRSEIGILYLCDFNRKIIQKLLKDYSLEFHPLIDCKAYVYVWKDHPLAGEESIGFDQLSDYPCLSFEQRNGSFYFSEEILSTHDYARTIKTTDRATNLNLMVGLNGYTLCSGIISEELNGSDYRAVPFRDDEEHPNTTMEIGFLVKKHTMLSRIGQKYVDELKRNLVQYGSQASLRFEIPEEVSEDKENIAEPPASAGK